MGEIKIGVPKGYDPKMDIRRTQQAIKYIKDTFEKELARALNLERVSAPLFVRPESGLNDNLSGVERPVRFDIPAIAGDVEVVQSLAKWKRMALKKYNFAPGEGLYTDMNAIRRDEELDNLHSVYVDQWDWEKIINKEERTCETLEDTVRKIYGCIKITEDLVAYRFPEVEKILPDQITFIDSEDLLKMYSHLSPAEREREICKKHGAVFIEKIGRVLSNGQKHDDRAPDYDDWELNGDILIWYEKLGCAMELSSMGVRVDEEALLRQLKSLGCEDRKELTFHKMLLNGQLPYTIGGGIGQSRLCMLLLKRAHIGEVQTSEWPHDMVKELKSQNVEIL